mmetsp:Transcript_36170/g.82454  ORF Transcript_36170/g.82454 Transcript_36170/m.82454 type:complete len:92 (+) Transcript_36170:44-319(+)
MAPCGDAANGIDTAERQCERSSAYSGRLERYCLRRATANARTQRRACEVLEVARASAVLTCFSCVTFSLSGSPRLIIFNPGGNPVDWIFKL